MDLTVQRGTHIEKQRTCMLGHQGFSIHKCLYVCVNIYGLICIYIYIYGLIQIHIRVCKI